MLRQIDKNALRQLIDAYVENISPNETTSCRIDLPTLKKFVHDIEKMKADGIRIYLTRPDVFELDLGNGTVTKLNDNKQLSFLIVPTTGTRGDRDLYHQDRILALQPGGENSGLCPPYCP